MGDLTGVVFVDDDLSLLDGLRRSLRPMKKSWEMVFTDDPSKALGAFSCDGIWVLVSDWAMPGCDGVELCRRAKTVVEKREDTYLHTVLLTGEIKTEAVVEALQSGIDDYIKKPCDTRELVARIQIGIRLLESAKELREANRELKKLATVDMLSGLFNRRRGNDILTSELNRVARGKQDLSVIMMDLDHFKRINDGYGHPSGDLVIKSVSATLNSNLRLYDSAVRWGGEEFLLICPHTGPEEAWIIAERCRQLVMKIAVEISGKMIEISASLGAATALTGQTVSVDAIVSDADKALYSAKDSGRNCTVQWK